MRLTFLGTGTSIGVPAIGCSCDVCRSAEPKDKRMRCSAIVETDEGLRILIDCGPDFRSQILKQEFKKFDAVLITHTHYDHVAGIDDLRPFCWFGNVDIYGTADVVDTLHHTMPYCFKKDLYPGVPLLTLHEIKPGKAFTINRPKEIMVNLHPSGAKLDGTLNTVGRTVTIPAVEKGIDILPVRVMHGQLPILGYRIGSLGYITDMKSYDEDTVRQMQGVDTLVVNALRFEKPHHSHQLVDDAIEFARKVRARRTLLIHVTHDIGTHELANRRLPEGIEFAYDGQIVDIHTNNGTIQ